LGCKPILFEGGCSYQPPYSKILYKEISYELQQKDTPERISNLEGNEGQMLCPINGRLWEIPKAWHRGV
jgi:hypothetical protein